MITAVPNAASGISIQVYANDEYIGEYICSEASSSITFDYSIEPSPMGASIRLVLVTSTWCPLDYGIDDGRTLSVPVSGVTVEVA